MTSKLADLVIYFSTDPFNPQKNFDIAVEYQKQNQTASAISFYLRTAEYGYDTHPDLVYASLLAASLCFDSQQNRVHTVINLMMQAISYQPTRPEAYFLFSRFCERDKEWQKVYTWASVGLAFVDKHDPLPIEVDYAGSACLLFEKAVAGWWIGQKTESKEIFIDLLKRDIPKLYEDAVINNLKQF
jgi:hypothetical protein